jgi:hypothetical protein
MEVRNRTTGTVITVHEFRELFAKEGARTIPVLSEEYITDRGYDVVFEGPQASGGTVYQYSMRQGVQEIGGKWYTKYILGPVFTDRAAVGDQPAKTAAEQEAEYKAMKDAEQAKSVRATRDAKLAALDWTQGKDIPDSISSPAALARQGLRDVPTQAGFPWTIDWPVAP